MSVKLSMTIGAKHHTFIQLTSDSVPAPGISFARNTEVFLRGIPMMKFKRFNAAIISAIFTLASLIIDGHLADLFPPLMDSLYKVLLSVAVCSLVFLHRLL